MRNSLAINFPDSKFLLCSKHLKDSIRHFLEKNLIQMKKIAKILRIIYSEDKDGLVFSSNALEFAEREDDLSVYFNKYPTFRTYYDRYLKSKLINNVYST